MARRSYLSISEEVYSLIRNKEIDVIEGIILSDVQHFRGIGKDCYKTAEMWAEELNVSVRTIKRKIKNLTEKNFLSSKRILRGRVLSFSDHFLLILSGQIGTCQKGQNDTQKGQNVPQKGQIGTCQKGQNGTYHNKITKEKNTRENKKIVVHSPTTQKNDFDEFVFSVVSHFNDVAGTNLKAEASVTKKLLGKIFKEKYSLDDCVRVINFKKWEVEQGRFDEYYFRISTLFAFDNFTKYLENSFLVEHKEIKKRGDLERWLEEE